MSDRRGNTEPGDVAGAADGRFPRRALLSAAGIAGAVAAREAMDASARARQRKHRKRKRRRNHPAEGQPGADPPNDGDYLFPRHLGYGAIRPSRWTQQQLDDHVRDAYDSWQDRYLVDAGNSGGASLYRIALGKPGTGNHDVTVSEGQGYGMVIVAHLAGYDPAAREIFDGLWRFARAHPSEIDGRLMDWRIPGGEGNNSAFDGDCDMAYGLLLADAQWGSEGAIDYGAALTQLLAGILASTIGPDSRHPLLGDWVDPHGQTHNQYTPRTSDFMPGHFRAFARCTGNAVWNAATDASQNVIASLQADYSPVTGLLPDFVEPVSSTNHTPRPASPGFLEGPRDGSYGYNAGRDPWRLGVDALLNGNSTSAAQARKISRWAATATNGNPAAFHAGYGLDGTPLPNSDYFTTFFVAPLGVAAMNDADAQDWLDAVYEAVYDVREDYYEDSVTLLCLLAMTGNFWDPTTRAGDRHFPGASLPAIQRASSEIADHGLI